MDKSSDTTKQIRKTSILTLLAGIYSDCNKKIINLYGIFLFNKILDISVPVNYEVQPKTQLYQSKVLLVRYTLVKIIAAHVVPNHNTLTLVLAFQAVLMYAKI